MLKPILSREMINFKNMTSVAKMAISTGDDMEGLNSARLDNGSTVAETLTNLVATIGENMSSPG